MTINTPYLQVSRDAALALTEFSDDFRSALTLGDFDVWASKLGYVRATNALKSTFPIPYDAAGYKEFKGDMKYRTLYERSMSMIQRRWQDGVEEFADVIEAPDFMGWAEAPGNMAREWERLPNVLAAEMLEANPLLDFYTDKDSKAPSTRHLFASDHPFNIFKSSVGSFDNTDDCSLLELQNGAFFKRISNYFRTLKGPNGKVLKFRMGGGSFLVPPALEQIFKEALESDTLLRAVSSDGKLDQTSNVVAATTRNNLYKGTFGYEVADELTDDNAFYAFASGGDPANTPFVVLTDGSPEEIVHDKTSEKYKDTLKVAIAFHGKMACSAALPHRIVKVTFTG